MKTIYLIGGTMGVGKTTTCQELKRMLPKAVFLDGDWCWDMDPFVVNQETKAMVMDNICACLNRFLRCSAFENVIFCWVMHQRSILDEILSRLDTTGWKVTAVSLICSEEVLRRRLEKDIDRGVRDVENLMRSVQRLPLYRDLGTVLIDTTGLSPKEAAYAVASQSRSETEKGEDQVMKSNPG